MLETAKPPVVMTIAGFDPSGGAGILADIKTIAAFDCFGVAAVTSLTFQNTMGVAGAHHQSIDTVRRQIATLFDDFEIAAIKTGMLPTREIVVEVASIIKAKSVPIVVVDPVLVSSSGFRLVEEGVAEALRSDLFPLASLVTPNISEAQLLSGEEIKDLPGGRLAAELILAMGPDAVLITGGDAESDSATDLLFDERGSGTYSAERIKSRNTHGTGCTLASALACLLARGHELRTAIPIAKRYVVEAMLSAPDLGHGHGPLNHLPAGPGIQN
ncbi:MAG TPA: bifunctional hydroxymethylpyrimidine kinase/phosphomethylpyrimidine kinase [Blastocatellia bacterium]|nr:bifunctional hydroxymethylpyrimidine kinase/phosphomethylpyrimidine kinase [Blastocatellia bacterium]